MDCDGRVYVGGDGDSFDTMSKLPLFPRSLNC